MLKNIEINNKRAWAFDNLKIKNLITSNDFGNVANVLFQGYKNGLTKTLKKYFKKNHLCIMEVQHGNKITIIKDEEVIKTKILYQCDSFIYVHNKKNVITPMPPILSMTTGDCPYIIFEIVDKEKIIFGGIHNGWRGVSLNIVGGTINKIIKDLNIPPSKIKIALWSGICKECYEISINVISIMQQYKNFIEKSSRGKWRLDLSGIIEQQLHGVGIMPDQIKKSRICPKCYCDAKGRYLLYSYRRGDKKERNGIFLSI